MNNRLNFIISGTIIIDSDIPKDCRRKFKTRNEFIEELKQIVLSSSILSDCHYNGLDLEFTIDDCKIIDTKKLKDVLIPLSVN